MRLSEVDVMGIENGKYKVLKLEGNVDGMGVE